MKKPDESKSWIGGIWISDSSFSLTGRNASIPFARLTISTSSIMLKSILGSFEFDTDDIVCIKPYGSIPFIGRGIKFVHKNSTYPKVIVFWHFS